MSSTVETNLEVVGIVLVVLVDFLGEERDGVADEEVRDVHGQRVVDAALAQPPVDRRVVHDRYIVIPDK